MNRTQSLMPRICRMLLSLLPPLLLWAGSLAVDSEYQLTIQRLPPMPVQEGLCIRVSCRVSYKRTQPFPRSVFGFWFRKGATMSSDFLVATNHPSQPVQKEAKGRFLLLGDPRDNNCSLDIRDARRSDTGEYFFRVESGAVKYSYKDSPLLVNVSALTQTPDFQVIETLESDRTVNLTCSVPWACERGTPPIFSWMSAALTSLGPRTTLSSVLTLTPRPQDHGTNLTCQVTFPGVGVTVKTTIRLNVTYAPQKLTIKAFGGNGTEPQVLPSSHALQLQEGEPLRLVCVADSNPPAEVHWKNLTLSLDQFHPSGELQLPQVELEDQGDYVCRAQNRLGALEVSVHLSVKTGKPCAETGVVWGAIAGAGLMVLLAIGLGLVFLIVKICRGRSAEKTVSREGPHPAKDAVSMGHLNVLGSDSQEDQQAPTATIPAPEQKPDHPIPTTVAPAPEKDLDQAQPAALTAGEESEPYYASLIFGGLTPTPDPEATDCEYSEIKVHK